jgi:hypothetical protein
MSGCPVQRYKRIARQALVKTDCGKQTLQKGCQQSANESEDEDCQQKGKQAGQKVGQCNEGPVCGLTQGEFDLLPHGRISLHFYMR